MENTKRLGDWVNWVAWVCWVFLVYSVCLVYSVYLVCSVYWVQRVYTVYDAVKGGASFQKDFRLSGQITAAAAVSSMRMEAYSIIQTPLEIVPACIHNWPGDRFLNKKIPNVLGEN